MDIQLEKIKIIQKLAEVDDEQIIKSIKKLLNISDDTDAEFIKKYGSHLMPMSDDELKRKALEAERDYRAGKFVDIASYFGLVEK
ncbi:MAG TPA: hypothetical protein ENJ95_12265 [Bacteroidetes bacterium]|nr:hypothetical protein [Bacteroidota bacterium]